MSTISLFGQSTADMATTGIADARKMYVYILQDAMRAKTIPTLELMLPAVEDITARLTEADRQSSDAILNDPIVINLRQGVSEAMAYISRRIPGMKKAVVQREIVRKYREEETIKKEAEAEGEEPPIEEKKFPWIPAAIGAGALLFIIAGG